MKNKMINVVTCDARKVTEESLAGFEKISINAAILIVDERSKALLNKYPVTVNAANIAELPEGAEITVKNINGKWEIGPETDGTGVLLMVNGKMTVAEGAGEALKSYYRIVVNGKLLMPKSGQGQCPNLQVNGRIEYYPDGATILKADTEIDDLFLSRAENSLYYCSGTLFFLETGIDAGKMLAKKMRFAAKRIVVAESMVDTLIPLFDEEAELVRVPDGTRHIDGDVELKMKTIRKYGAKLCISGDVAVRDAEALSSLEYLFTAGTLSVNKDLEEALDEIESCYGKLKIIDPNVGYIIDRPVAKVGAALLRKYPNGVRIEDCARVVLSEQLSTEDIVEKLHISDCALVVCTKEQEEAVHMIAEDVAMIRVSEQASEGEEEGMLGSLFGRLKDTQVINAVEYTL
ncbi:MAG: hypothetical protein SOR89_04285 [Ndongobacter sp.]|nr:hypothetical protein [Ndongobacter sp.]